MTKDSDGPKKVVSIGPRAQGAWERIVDNWEEQQRTRFQGKPLDFQQQEERAEYIEWRQRVFAEKIKLGLIPQEEMEEAQDDFDMDIHDVMAYDTIEWREFYDGGGTEPATVYAQERKEIQTHIEGLRNEYRQSLKDNHDNSDFDADRAKRELEAKVFDLENISRRGWYVEQQVKALLDGPPLSEGDRQNYKARRLRMLLNAHLELGVQQLIAERQSLGTYYEILIAEFEGDGTLTPFQAGQLRRGNIPADLKLQDSTSTGHSEPDPSDSLR